MNQHAAPPQGVPTLTEVVQWPEGDAPWSVASTVDAEHEYQVTLQSWAQLPKAQAIVAAVSHKEYKELTPAAIAAMTVPGGVFVDVKSIFDPLALAAAGLRVWRL